MEDQRTCLGEAPLPVSTLSEPLVSGKGADLATAEDLEAAQLPPYRDTAGASFSRTCLNLTNAVSGIGVLSMPYAVAQGGWLSLALFALVGALCYYTGTLIGRCMHADPAAVASYPDMRARLRVCRPECRRRLHGDNLDKLFPGARVELLGGYNLQGKQLFIALAAAVVLPTTWLKNLGVLAYVSAVGLVASAVLTASLVWAGVAETGFHRNSTSVFNLSGLPTSLGLCFVCFTGHAVFPTIYSSMKNNKHFSRVLLISSVLCSVNYGLTAVLGYMIYGDGVQSQITLNLLSGKLYTKVAILTTIINPLAKYALLAVPITAAIEEKFSLPAGSGPARVSISTVVVVSTAVVASTVPFFGYLMSFIGSFLSVMATVIFPCLCFLKIYKAEGIRRIEIAAITGILMIGVFVAVTGTYTSVRQIIGTF
ncbi:vesicular GABA transporter-like [Panicum miliaceum]|uniref:Vesicular GABA transporter-like n=1 Tax=Panicum miliaceum TaxID=4540 RepID=A0A3L6QZ70_PANMI|nr:vesicular GABA transporter-like [Panicum miliaceum]